MRRYAEAAGDEQPDPPRRRGGTGGRLRRGHRARHERARVGLRGGRRPLRAVATRHGCAASASGSRTRAAGRAHRHHLPAGRATRICFSCRTPQGLAMKGGWVDARRSAPLPATDGTIAGSDGRGPWLRGRVPPQVDTPTQRTALVWHGQEITYRELYELAGKAGAQLVGLDLDPDEPVGVLAKKSPAAIALVLGLRAGGAAFSVAVAGVRRTNADHPVLPRELSLRTGAGRRPAAHTGGRTAAAAGRPGPTSRSC